MKKWMTCFALLSMMPVLAWGKGLAAQEQKMKAEYCPVKGEKCSTLEVNRAVFADKRYTELADHFLKQRLELKSLAAVDLNHWIKEATTPSEPGEEFYPQEYQTGVALYGYTSRYLVLQTNDYEYTGGAHGMSTFYYHVYRRDLPQQPIKLKDIVMPGQQKRLDELQRRAWMAYLKKEGFSTKEIKEHLQYFEFKATDNWAPTANGLQFLYQPYEIGPYSMGTPELLIPTASLKSIIQPQFLNELKYFHQVIDN